MAVKQFVDKFHSLSGKTTGEKLKNLNKLITDVNSSCSEQEIHELITEIKPANNFEKLLKGRLIQSFKKTQDLLDVLKCQDRLFINQVLGCDWFFEGSSVDFPTCEFFITDVFPNTSFIVRNDIIHLLSVHLKDHSIAEKFYKAVRHEYGIQQARPLLCACSADFIQSVLDADDELLKFTNREVSKLTRKHTALIGKNIKKKCFAAYLQDILGVMVEVNMEMFIELFESMEHVYPRIGRRASKKIIRFNPAAVVKSAPKYIHIMKPDILHKYLCLEDFTQFYINLFPKSIESSFFQDSGDFYRVVEVQTPEKRLETLLSCFKKVYGLELLAQTDLIREKLLLLLPPDKREMCAQQKIDKCLSKDEDETYWICYLTIKKSVPMLKKLLQAAPDLDSRCRLIRYILLTCKINDDLETLARELGYIVNRYRNDDFTLRIGILSELADKFDLLKVGDKHWTSILEVIKIFFLTEEYDIRNWVVSDILSKAVHYKLKQQADICEQIDQLIIIKGRQYYTDWILVKEEPKYQIIIFQTFCERVPISKKVKLPLTKLAYTLLSSVSEWNKENKLFQFSLSKFPWAVESLRTIVETDLDGNKTSVLELLRFDLETKQLVCPDFVYLEKVNKDMIYFLKMDAEIFIENARAEVQYLLDNRTKSYKHLFRTWNLKSFIKIREVVVKICTTIVASEEETDIRKNAIFVLSFLLDADSFKNVIKPFYPASEKIDVYDKQTETMLPLTETSAISLKNVNPWNDYDCIKQFCKGDYLKYVLGSLMSVCYNTLQMKIVSFLEGLVNSPVSVKKHAVRLLFNIVARPQLLPLLRNWWSSDRNPAMREVFIVLVWRAFVAEPTSEMFGLLKYCLTSLSVDDKNIFDRLSRDTAIPDHYKAEYVELCWVKLHDLLQQGAKIKPQISDLVSRFQHLVGLLPSSFCDRVIRQYFHRGSPYMDAITNFAVKYVVTCHTQDELNERFNLILDLFKNLIGRTAAGRKEISLFINCLCTEVLICECRMVSEVLQKFLSIWPSVLSPVHKFETFMLLNFTSLYFSCVPKFNLVAFGKIISDYVTSVLEEYGLEVITVVSTSFVTFVESVETWHREKFEKLEIRLSVITGLLSEPFPKHAYIMAAYLIPGTQCEELKDKYTEVIKTIFKVEDKAVCLLVNSLPVFYNNLALLDNVMTDDDTFTPVL